MAAIQAQGTTLTFNNGTIGVVVGGIKTFSGFDGESSEIDITTLASTAKEFDVGLEDFGSFSIDLIFNPNDAGQAAISAAKTSAATRQVVLTLPSGTIKKATFNVIVKSFSKSGGVDGVVESTANFRITGAVVWS